MEILSKIENKKTLRLKRIEVSEKYIQICNISQIMKIVYRFNALKHHVNIMIYEMISGMIMKLFEFRYIVL